VTPTATVIICTHTPERWALLEAAVGSVRGQTVAASQLVVVVDHHDELLARARGAFADAAVVANGGRRGLSGARNTGMALATGEVVVFLDDDANADPRWLEHLLPAYADPCVAGVGGRIDPAWVASPPAWFPPEFLWVVGCSYTGLPVTTGPVRNLIGANMSFRTALARQSGAFRSELGRVGATPLGCEETEFCVRMATVVPGATFLYEPTALVHHQVPAARATPRYFLHRCWSEGLSKAAVARVTDRTAALSSERSYATSTLPRAVARQALAAFRERSVQPLGQAAAVGAGLLTTAAGYGRGRLHDLPIPTLPPPRSTMPQPTRFSVHGLVQLEVAADAPTLDQLAIMLAPFVVDSFPAGTVADIVVDGTSPDLLSASVAEHELTYTDDAVRIEREGVTVVRVGDGYRVHGRSELLTTVIPLIDIVAARRGAAMVHAATVAWRGEAICMGAAGGVGKTSTVAKLIDAGAAFMGDDWGFATRDGQLLSYRKPMFIKPHHRHIYPHMFAAKKKPLVPKRISKQVGRLTTIVHPLAVRRPKLAAQLRRWSPEYILTRPEQALPGAALADAAPLGLAVYVERYHGETVRLDTVDRGWMVDRLAGNYYAELPLPSRELFTALVGAGLESWDAMAGSKAAILAEAFAGLPCHRLRVPVAWSADAASDAIVATLLELTEKEVAA
jgi:hypothetical protein